MTDIEEEAGRRPYGEYLGWFLRGVALLWFAKGLRHWFQLVGLGEGEHTRFLAAMAPATQAAIVFFAVIDLIAAVGLWMGAAWGGVIWLVAAMAHLLLVLFMPAVFGPQPAFSGVIVGLVAIYLVLVFLAARGR